MGGEEKVKKREKVKKEGEKCVTKEETNTSKGNANTARVRDKKNRSKKDTKNMQETK